MGVYEEVDALMNFWHNLCTGSLWVSFEERLPASYYEAYDWAIKQVAIEEKCNMKRECEKAEELSQKGKERKKTDT